MVEPPVTVDKITTRPAVTLAGQLDQVCGTCGCVVAYGHVARHKAWHAAAWGSPVVTSDTTVGP